MSEKDFQKWTSKHYEGLVSAFISDCAAEFDKFCRDEYEARKIL